MASIVTAAWPTVALGEVATSVERAEVPVPGKLYRQVGVRLWGQGAYERELLDGGATQYKTLSRVEAGDIIVNKIWARNGSVSIITQDLAGAYVSGEFPTFAPHRERLDPKWFKWLTKTRPFWDQCDEKSRGTSGKNRIRPEKFLEIPIPLPPLDEQRRNVARIEELAACIEEAKGLRREASNDCERLLVAMAHRADLDAAAKRLARWQEVAIGDIVRFVQTPHRVDSQASYPNFGIYSFGRGLFPKPPIQGIATSADVLYRVRSGQFIYSRLFAFEGAYGTVTDEFDGYFVSNEYPTFDCDPEKVTADFLSAYFKAPHVWSAVAVGSKGLGDRRQRVQPAQVLAHRLWLPPLAWQHRIAGVRERMDGLKRLQQETAAEVDALLPSVLDIAFRGKL